MIKFLFILVAGSGAVFAGCIPVTGNRIQGHDLALADSHFAALPASLTIGFAPPPGTKRTYTAPELQRIARANGISVTGFGDICFEIPMRRLTEEDVTAAIRRSLPTQAMLRVVELSKFDVPAGVLEFPLDGLEPANAVNHGVQLWRGHVSYAETRQASVWARVQITETLTAVVAAKDLPADTSIDARSLRIETRTGPLEKERPAVRIEDVQGRIPRRALQAGSIIPIAILTDAPAVRKGDPVAVEVRSGPASLHLEAIAEGSARNGDMVELRNPANGKTFKARLDAGPKALLVIAPGQHL
ncbi:MAG TPA: flagellar basal body P-ring formation chaperone FlgA [Bryobacteraceae bacterium]|jgi:flagella basal body P-ring formation protein FlgA|nr:flagellar basal body P-ring formation chaperone FlgA [Bryobacteraceae bacterium]